MSRQVSDTNLSTRAARGELKPRSKPYWRLIDHGRHIGYRRTPRGGAWVARLYLGSGKYAETRLGTADNIADADEVEVLAWGQAQPAALADLLRRENGRGRTIANTLIICYYSYYSVDVRPCMWRCGDIY